MSKKKTINTQSPSKKIKYCNVIDLFAGAGGLSLGFEQIKGNVRFRVKVAFENNPNMQETYKKNHRSTVVRGDVCEADFYEISKEFGPFDVVIGGPPCQGFSNANRQRYAAINLNNKLVKQYIRAITELQPKAFVMENVSMLKSDVHRFYMEETDVEIIDKYHIETKTTPLVLLDQEFYFEGAEKYIGHAEQIDANLWPEQLETEMRVIYKVSKNQAKMRTTLDKHKTRILKAVDSYIALVEENKADNPITTQSIKACDALINYYSGDYNLSEIRDMIEPAIMIQRMLSRMKEIIDNHIVIDNTSTENGIIVSIRTFAVYEYLEKILKSDDYKYTLKSDILCAADYGAPQKRMRFVIVGVKKSISDEVTLPTARFTPDRYNTVREAIEDLEKVQPIDDITMDQGIPVKSPTAKTPLSKLRDSNVLWNHIVTKTTPTALSRFKVIKQGENFHALSDELKSNTYTDPARTQNTIYLRLNYDEPCGTVVNVRKSMWIHPVNDRAISVREAARLQTFPDSFIFCGTKDQQYQQVGNAVPPIMAKAIAKKVAKLLRKANIK